MNPMMGQMQQGQMQQGQMQQPQMGQQQQPQMQQGQMQRPQMGMGQQMQQPQMGMQGMAKSQGMPGPGMNGSSPNGPPQVEPGVSKAAMALKGPPGPLNLQMPLPGPLNLQMPAGPLQLSAPSPLLFQS